MKKCFLHSATSSFVYVLSDIIPSTARNDNYAQLFKTLCIVLFFLTLASATHAMPPSESPHKASAIETGVITGKLLKDGKAPLAGETVVLEIFQGGSLVLAIPKQTDAAGRYEFKNIFQTPEFEYAISSELDGKTYRTDLVSLKKGEKERVLNLTAGAGAKEAAPLPPPPPLQPPDEEKGHSTEMHRHYKDTGQYKLLAILLSIGAIGYAIYRRKK